MVRLAKMYQATEQGIRNAVFGLQRDLQLQRELTLELVHRFLVVALHTDSHWTKAKWR